MSRDSEGHFLEGVAFDLIKAGNQAFNEKRSYQNAYLEEVIVVALDRIGDRHRQYNLTNDYLEGIVDTLGSQVQTARRELHLFGLRLKRNQLVSSYWTWPSETADVIARSVVLTILRHFTGSAEERTSGLRTILFMDMQRGLNWFVAAMDRVGHPDSMQQYQLGWAQDINEHREFLRNPTAR